jgi:prephenate dehydratase
LRAGVEDHRDNETRFVWLASDARRPTPDAPAKTTIVFWGAGSERPGWLARCLTEFADRGVSLTKIESRPRKVGLGRYMFFLDCVGGVGDADVAAALEGVRSHVDTLKVLGSYPSA